MRNPGLVSSQHLRERGRRLSKYQKMRDECKAFCLPERDESCRTRDLLAPPPPHTVNVLTLSVLLHVHLRSLPALHLLSSFTTKTPSESPPFPSLSASLPVKPAVAGGSGWRPIPRPRALTQASFKVACSLQKELRSR